jgi:hypothetical protein
MKITKVEPLLLDRFLYVRVSTGAVGFSRRIMPVATALPVLASERLTRNDMRC